MHGIVAAAAKLLTAPVAAYANAGGTGNRNAIITVLSNITWDSGTDAVLVNGGFANTTTDSVDAPGLGSTAILATNFIRFYFNGLAKYIDEVKIYGQAVTPNNGLWNLQGSNDAAGWTTYGSANWNTTVLTVPLTGVPPEGHLYYRWVPNAAGVNWANGFISEFEFKIAPGAT